MKLFKSLLLSVLFVAALSFTGCNEEPTTSTPDNTTNLSKLEIPEGAVISSATFNIYVEDATTNNATLHNVNIPWSEAETWNSFFGLPSPPGPGPTGNEFDPNSLGNFNGTAGLHTVVITALVQAWVDGTTPNYGVLLNQPISADGYTVFRSSEYIGTDQPFLEVTYTVNGGAPVTKKEPAFIDTYIWSIYPANSFGNEQYLRLAHIDNYRKYVLVQFDIESTPGEEHCETAYAFGDTPFCGLPDIGNWGWTEYINGNYTKTDIPIYAGAAQCDPTKGTQVGTLSIIYAGTSLTVNYTMNSGVTVDNVHMWIGETKLPTKKNGKLTSAPGQFNYNNVTFPFSLTKLNPFYIAVHFDVCWFE